MSPAANAITEYVDPVDAWVERQLATSKPLSEKQRTDLAELLRPVRRQAVPRGR